MGAGGSTAASCSSLDARGRQTRQFSANQQQALNRKQQQLVNLQPALGERQKYGRPSRELHNKSAGVGKLKQANSYFDLTSANQLSLQQQHLQRLPRSPSSIWLDNSANSMIMKTQSNFLEPYNLSNANVCPQQQSRVISPAKADQCHPIGGNNYLRKKSNAGVASKIQQQRQKAAGELRRFSDSLPSLNSLMADCDQSAAAYHRQANIAQPAPQSSHHLRAQPAPVHHPNCNNSNSNHHQLRSAKQEQSAAKSLYQPPNHYHNHQQNRHPPHQHHHHHHQSHLVSKQNDRATNRSSQIWPTNTKQANHPDGIGSIFGLRKATSLSSLHNSHHQNINHFPANGTKTDANARAGQQDHQRLTSECMNTNLAHQLKPPFDLRQQKQYSQSAGQQQLIYNQPTPLAKKIFKFKQVSANSSNSNLAKAVAKSNKFIGNKQRTTTAQVRNQQQAQQGCPVLPPLPRSQSLHELIQLRATENGQRMRTTGTLRGAQAGGGEQPISHKVNLVAELLAKRRDSRLHQAHPGDDNDNQEDDDDEHQFEISAAQAEQEAQVSSSANSTVSRSSRLDDNQFEAGEPILSSVEAQLNHRPKVSSNKTTISGQQNFQQSPNSTTSSSGFASSASTANSISSLEERRLSGDARPGRRRLSPISAQRIGPPESDRAGGQQVQVDEQLGERGFARKKHPAPKRPDEQQQQQQQQQILQSASARCLPISGKLKLSSSLLSIVDEYNSTLQKSLTTSSPTSGDIGLAGSLQSSSRAEPEEFGGKQNMKSKLASNLAGVERQQIGAQSESESQSPGGCNKEQQQRQLEQLERYTKLRQMSQSELALNHLSSAAPLVQLQLQASKAKRASQQSGASKPYRSKLINLIRRISDKSEKSARVGPRSASGAFEAVRSSASPSCSSSSSAASSVSSSAGNAVGGRPPPGRQANEGREPASGNRLAPIDQTGALIGRRSLMLCSGNPAGGLSESLCDLNFDCDFELIKNCGPTASGGANKERPPSFARSSLLAPANNNDLKASKKQQQQRTKAAPVQPPAPHHHPSAGSTKGENNSHNWRLVSGPPLSGANPKSGAKCVSGAGQPAAASSSNKWPSGGWLIGGNKAKQRQQQQQQKCQQQQEANGCCLKQSAASKRTKSISSPQVAPTISAAERALALENPNKAGQSSGLSEESEASFARVSCEANQLLDELDQSLDLVDADCRLARLARKTHSLSDWRLDCHLGRDQQNCRHLNQGDNHTDPHGATDAYARDEHYDEDDDDDDDDGNYASISRAMINATLGEDCSRPEVEVGEAGLQRNSQEADRRREAETRIATGVKCGQHRQGCPAASAAAAASASAAHIQRSPICHSSKIQGRLAESLEPVKGQLGSGGCCGCGCRHKQQVNHPVERAAVWQKCSACEDERDVGTDNGRRALVAAPSGVKAASMSTGGCNLHGARESPIQRASKMPSQSGQACDKLTSNGQHFRHHSSCHCSSPSPPKEPLNPKSSIPSDNCCQLKRHHQTATPNPTPSNEANNKSSPACRSNSDHLERPQQQQQYPLPALCNSFLASSNYLPTKSECRGAKQLAASQLDLANSAEKRRQKNKLVLAPKTKAAATIMMMVNNSSISGSSNQLNALDNFDDNFILKRRTPNAGLKTQC